MQTAYIPNIPGINTQPTPASTTSTTATPSPGVPLAQPTPDGKKDMVISPFKPYNVIDVKGYKSGDIVGDPSTAKVNPTTGKVDLTTAKHFRIP